MTDNDSIRYGGKTVKVSSGLADFILRRARELNDEDQKMRANLSEEGKRFDPEMHRGLAVRGFECRVHPRWHPSGAESGESVHTIDFHGLTVCPDVVDVASFDRVMRERVPKYIRDNGKLGG